MKSGLNNHDSVHTVTTSSTDAWRVLDLEPGATRSIIKARFYELAKQTHPDVLPAADDDARPEELRTSVLEMKEREKK